MTPGRPAGPRPCPGREEELAELALGILPGDGRVHVLTHVAECDGCRAEAERLTATADAVLHLAPGVEPPVGFEVRLFERLGVPVPDPAHAPEPAADRRDRRRVARPGRVRVAVVGLAAAVAAALGFGGGWLAASGPAPRHTQYPQPTVVATAHLTSGHETVGSVATYTGSPGWVLMTVKDSPVSGMVICEVTMTDGRRVPVGTFTLEGGYGAWSAPLPVDPHDVRSAAVIAPNGTVVGTADLTTA